MRDGLEKTIPLLDMEEVVGLLKEVREDALVFEVPDLKIPLPGLDLFKFGCYVGKRIGVFRLDGELHVRVLAGGK